MKIQKLSKFTLSCCLKQFRNIIGRFDGANTTNWQSQRQHWWKIAEDQNLWFGRPLCPQHSNWQTKPQCDLFLCVDKLQTWSHKESQKCRTYRIKLQGHNFLDNGRLSKEYYPPLDWTSSWKKIWKTVWKYNREGRKTRNWRRRGEGKSTPHRTPKWGEIPPGGEFPPPLGQHGGGEIPPGGDFLTPYKERNDLQGGNSLPPEKKITKVT